jgi:hypothetical protein
VAAVPSAPDIVALAEGALLCVEQQQRALLAISKDPVGSFCARGSATEDPSISFEHAGNQGEQRTPRLTRLSKRPVDRRATDLQGLGNLGCSEARGDSSPYRGHLRFSPAPPPFACRRAVEALGELQLSWGCWAA